MAQKRMSPEMIRDKNKYDWVMPFDGAFAQASQNGRQFHVRTNGRPAYRQRFDFVGLFSRSRCKLARVKRRGKCYHIRTNGKAAYRQRFDEAMHFFEEKAWVKKGESWFYIGPDGKRISG